MDEVPPGICIHHGQAECHDAQDVDHVHHEDRQGDVPDFMPGRSGIQQKKKKGLVELFQAGTGMIDDERADPDRGGIVHTEQKPLQMVQALHCLAKQQLIKKGCSKVGLPGGEVGDGGQDAGNACLVAGCGWLVQQQVVHIAVQPIAAQAPKQMEGQGNGHKENHPPEGMFVRMLQKKGNGN